MLYLVLVYASLKSMQALEILNGVSGNYSNVNGLTGLRRWLKTTTLPTISNMPSDEEFTRLDFGFNNEDKYLNFTQLANKYGYKVEIYKVQTKDCYIITLLRIPGCGPPVFLMHGLFSSARDWITPGPKSSVAYLLANRGYDVWLGNARGNIYSTEHLFLSPDKDAARYWNFSWHEIGCYDLPAMIDHILNTTGATNLKYVGHSQGCTAFFVMCSKYPEYNEKLLFIGLSPLAWMTHTLSPLKRALSIGSPVISITSQLIGLYNFIPNNQLISILREALCGTTLLASTLCTHIIFLFSGINYGQLNYTNMNVLLSQVPSSCATKQLIHYTQLVNSERFQMFDYGPNENRKVYGGSPNPPEYDVKKITAPVALFYGNGDWLATLPDMTTLSNNLPNVIEFYKVPFDNFNHFDPIWGIDVETLIVSRIIYLFQKYSS